MKSIELAGALLLLLASCSPDETVVQPAVKPGAKPAGNSAGKPAPRPVPKTTTLPTLPMDHHSLSNPNAVRVTHIALDLTLDFEAKTVRGTVRLDFVRMEPRAPLILDTQSLTIVGIRGTDGKPRKHTSGKADRLLGQALRIEIADGDSSVTIEYSTAPESAALQWLARVQTAGAKMPYVYTQGQAILTRSWIPLQDTPGVRVTYEARVRAPKDMTVVMSAAERGTDEGVFVFKMPQAIPSYLIAMACGDIAFGKISDRCGVFADPTILASAVKEFSDTEKMLSQCEAKFGTYGWGRYDLLVLPPAFPFGGMENPTLTFVTPTIIIGDKSLVALVAHELAHSWSGNLVTNATWRDFWLNEGFTVYLEHRIMELVFGKERAAMEIETSVRELRKEVAELPKKDQILHIDLTGRNPDDAMTAIAYDKGAAFLRRLDEVFGRETFDDFLQAYFKAHAFQSITTARFLEFLDKNLLSKDPKLAAKVDVNNWVFGSGLPDTLPTMHSKGFSDVSDYLLELIRHNPKPLLDTRNWITHQWLELLAGAPADMSPEQVDEWDQRFGFAFNDNPEIRCAFLVLALDRGQMGLLGAAMDFVREIGRRKFVLPIFKSMTKSEEGRTMARQLFAEIKDKLHSITRNSVAKIVK